MGPHGTAGPTSSEPEPLAAEEVASSCRAVRAADRTAGQAAGPLLTEPHRTLVAS